MGAFDRPTTAEATAPDRTSALRGAALRATVPIVIVGAVSAGLTGPVDRAAAAPRSPERARPSTDHTTRADIRPAAVAVAVVQQAPASYTVVRGDTVSSIAERYGLSTPAVLAMNGLGWSSLIHPGQVLRLSAPAPAAPAPAAPAPTQAVGAQVHTVARGDTISAIAARYGVATATLLAANGLGWSSIIYPGQRITVPAATPMRLASAVTPAPAAAAPAPPAVSIGLSAEATANARTIIQVGRSLGVPDRGIVIALAAAAQESSLANLPAGDSDSVGLFQQRPSQGWGAREQLLDPAYASRLFYGGASNPNAGRTRGLLDIPGWQGMSVTAAAQAVQISAYPDRYARWEAPATSWLAALG